jgi:hypothetical protein
LFGEKVSALKKQKSRVKPITLNADFVWGFRRLESNRVSTNVRGVEPLGRPENWTASGWAKGKMEGGPTSGKGGSLPPSQDGKVCVVDKSRRVRGS